MDNKDIYYMKYIDADKLYEKVDALMAHYAKAEEEMKDDVELSIFYQGKRKMCSEIINLIDSLQQEKISFKKVVNAKGHISLVPYSPESTDKE